jgi:uncharacterized protein (DUF1778 family)
MARTRSKKQPGSQASRTLVVSLDEEDKAYLAQAARLRGLSVGDYARMAAVGQARMEVLAARKQTIALTPDEQREFWRALSATPKLTDAQRLLGKLMREAGK